MIPILIPMSIRIAEFFQRYPGASQPLKAPSAGSRAEFVEFQEIQETQLPDDDPRYVPSPGVFVGDQVDSKEDAIPPGQPNPKSPRGSIISEQPPNPPSLPKGLSGKVDVEAQAEVRKKIAKAEQEANPKAKAKGKAAAKKKGAPKAKVEKSSPARGAKRRLEPELAAAADSSGASVEVQPSPKARRLAGRVDPSEKAQALQVRQEKAAEGLALLRDASLTGLILPSDDFNKMHLIFARGSCVP